MFKNFLPDFQLMNLLVTGGAGFIGSHFIRTFIDNHPLDNIVNLDALTYAGNSDNTTDFEKYLHYTFFKGDIADQELVETIIRDCKIEAIVNFAAETHVDNSIQNSRPFIHSNVEGVRSLLDAIRKTKIQRFVQISTDEVYGSIENGIFTEESPLKPRSPYAASKAAADHFVQAYYETYKIPALITRSSNNFGPRQYPEKYIPVAVTNLIEGEKIPVYGAGKNIRDWLYVVDNCEAIDTVLHSGKIGEVYNVSGGNERENIEIARMIAQTFGKNEEAIQFVPDRLGHDFRYALSHDKIARELGWKPRHSFEEALHDTICWYKNNEQWWKKLKQK